MKHPIFALIDAMDTGKFISMENAIVIKILRELLMEAVSLNVDLYNIEIVEVFANALMDFGKIPMENADLLTALMEHDGTLQCKTVSIFVELLKSLSMDTVFVKLAIKKIMHMASVSQIVQETKSELEASVNVPQDTELLLMVYAFLTVPQAAPMSMAGVSVKKTVEQKLCHIAHMANHMTHSSDNVDANPLNFGF